MAKLSGQQIRELAKTIVYQNPGGIRFGALMDRIKQESPETPTNTISSNIWDLERTYSAHISKPSRGLYKPADGGGANDDLVVVGITEQIAPSGARIRESDFYEPFAEWLKNDLDEVTDVASLGGASMKTKWGTPDVIGVYKPLAANLIKFPLEIVSVEIKIDPQAPVVAFGQAMAYRLFLVENLRRHAQYPERGRSEPVGIAGNAVRHRAGPVRRRQG